ncbi:hypothetical protein [Paraburkholderia aspalathi]|uniref:hypothetical protein n=1 Tax=Paraburkholderia aspalathi TaxID=1324617 RepID=UPI0038BAFF17
MALHIIGRCSNCKSLTSRVTDPNGDDNDDKQDRRVHQCRGCAAKGLKPVERETKRKKPSADLPRHIEDALAGARYVVRSSDESGFPRVVATIPAFGSIMLGGEGGEDIVARIERVWPTLDEIQVRRVVKYIDAGAVAAIRAATERPGRPKKRWLTDY